MDTDDSETLGVSLSSRTERSSTRRRPVALVTGGSAGIGNATVVELARRGYDVGFTYRSRERAAGELAREVEALGTRAVCRHLDLAAAADDGRRVVEQLVAELGGVDVLVNNAAINTRGSVLEQPLGAWRETLEVNLLGPVACAQAAARAMVARGRGGAIVNVSSVVAQVPLPQAAAYCAAKAGLEMLTRVMAIELAPLGIRVNAVAPGHTVTAMNYADGNPAATGSGAAAGMGAATAWPQIPLGRSAAPAEIARAIAFLASPQASYATGAALLVDGGLALVSGPGVLQEATGLPPGDQAERSAASVPSTSRSAST